MVIAKYETSWQHLSKDHEKIDSKLSKILGDYATDQLEHLAYAVIGTFGVGKTQFLYNIHKCAKDKGLLPLFFIAEDLFREAINANNKIITPGDIFTLVKGKVERLKEALFRKNGEGVRRILDPRGKLENDAPELVNIVVKEFSNSDVVALKVILLIDELEGQYGVLQTKVQTKDRSPLREWLEDKDYLKFLAFAPAGVYELGGADRDRVKRIVLPPTDIKYIREKLISHAGRSNACWWLSRGKARQLFKAYEVLKEKDNITIDSAAASRIIKSELDQIGQEPTQVPSAVTSSINPSKIPFLLNLQPITGENVKRYVIDTNSLDTGILADKLVEAFSMNRDNALLISEYFKRTVKALSGENWLTYIDDKDLPELFKLVFDHILEYELGSPELSDRLGEMLNLYEKVSKENAALYGIVGRLWELKETDLQLPLTVEEIRKTFPFPSMNPIVKNHLPADMRKKWEGKSLPIWKWIEGDITILFFASKRDFANYSETDEFISNALPDGKGILCVFSTGEKPKDEKLFLAWLKENKKLEFVEFPPLLTDFLLSVTGEIQEGIPGGLQLYLKNLKENKGDILLSRKSEIYSEAINEIIRGSIPKPDTFYKGDLPDTGTVWGKGQMDRDIAINGLALAFVDLTPQERQLLSEIRELFRSGKEGRGAGDLNTLMPRGGYIALSDDLLPRYGKKKDLKDSEPVGRLKRYWRGEERNKLVELSRILPREHFLKLHSDEDMNRLLEALWKTVRVDFNFKNIETSIQKFEREIFPALKDCWELEQEVIRNFGVSGINFEDKEKLVKAKDGINKILEIAKETLKDTGSAAPLIKCIVNTFMKAVEGNIERNIRNLAYSSDSVKRAVEELKNASENIKKNFWEYPEATKFIGITEDDIKTIVSKQMRIDGSPTLQALEASVKERKEYLEDVSKNLSLLNEKLNKLKYIFSQIKEEA